MVVGWGREFPFLGSVVMDDSVLEGAEKNRGEAQDSERVARLQERLERALREAAQIEVELSRVDGTIRGVPHYSVIEGRAHRLGKQLSREIQQRQMRELTADQSTTCKCPTCGRRCAVRPKERTVQTVDGDSLLTEGACYCAGCRRSFFPTA